MSLSLAIAAPAKINLYLHVLARRDDGYHLLDSLIAFAAVGDRVEVAPASALILTIEGPFAPGLSAGEDNLVLRAARALAQAAGRPAGAAIRLVKNLPVASGIGGGSSDAAAAFKALDALWGLGMDADTLARLGLGLGADVPVCLAGRPSRIGGVGERITSAPALPPFGVVLVNPGVPVATAAVFRGLQGRFSPPADEAPEATTTEDFAAWLAGQGNDLTAPARQLAPGIGEALDALAASRGCLLARLSGSGATCFGLYADGDTAAAAAEAVRAAHAGWWVVATRFIDTPPAVTRAESAAKG